MAVKFPDSESRRYLGGGVANWDDAQASVILSEDYFEAAAPPSGGGQVKAFVGGSFVAKPVKVWDGSAWVIKPLKIWNGSAWVATSY